MRALLQDVAYFFRTIPKAPGFFAVAVLTLALGIGANTAIFSVINSVLLRPLPFDEPDRLVRLFQTEAAPGNYPFTGPDYLDWQAQNKTLEGTALFTWFSPVNVSGSGQPQSALATRTEADFFTVLGARPLSGRTFVTGEDAAGASRVAVISYGFWQRHFGGDPAVLGQSIKLDSEPHTVVGVMPAWFNYPRSTEIWRPLEMTAQNLGSRGSHSYQAIGRLKRGVSVEQAQADLAVIAKRLEQQYPDTNEKVGAAVVALKEQLTERSREPLLILLGAVALVLLVACANVANLLLIRASGRRRELAIRSALGAGRWRVVRQLLTESLLLAFAGGAAGLAAAWWGVRLIRSVKTLPIPLVNPVAIDAPVLLFTLGAAVATGVLFGVLPALQASGIALGDELKSGSQTVAGAGTRARRVRDAIAVAEIALSLALLVGAGLLLRSFDRMRHADTGVDGRQVLTFTLNLPEAVYDGAVARRAFFDQFAERLRSTPGVQTVAFSTQIPLEGGSNGYITVPGREDAALRNQLFEWNYVTPDYFRTFGIPLLEGRNFTTIDEERAAEVMRRIDEIFASPNPPRDALAAFTWPAVINRTMARLVWPKESAVGKTFLMGGGLKTEVIGVVADVSVRGVRSQSLPQAHLAFAATMGDPYRRYVEIRTATAPASLLGAVRSHVGALDSTLAVMNPRTMDDVMADGMSDTTLQAWLLGSFALLAAVLAAVGLYSVMAFLVAQRRHELGVRTALGARQGELMRLVLGHGTRLIAAGVVLGLAAAYWLSRVIRGLLFGIEPNDTLTFAAVSTLLVLVALAACAIPARRASRVDPLVALRYE